MTKREDSSGGGDGADPRQAEIVVLTGRSGAGRSTAINALEDIGFETVDRPPICFAAAIAERLAAAGKRVAIGLDVTTDGFSEAAFAALLETLRAGEGRPRQVATVFMDCDTDALRRRYVETRRRHPMALRGSIEDGLAADSRASGPLRRLADMVVDTSAMVPSDLKREMQARFADDGAPGVALSVVSFSYKHGLPPEADLVVDCRFLRNPHYDPALKPLDGRAPEVAAFVAGDALYQPFVDQLVEQAQLLLPAFAREGKSYVTVAFGCTGGQHRSVAVAEAYAKALADRGWRPRLRHRERPDADR